MNVQTLTRLALAAALMLAASAIYAKSLGTTNGLAAVEPSSISTNQNASILLRQARAIFGHLPSSMPGSDADTPEMVSLGKILFFEKGMSINKQQSCNDCHGLGSAQAGVDNNPTSPGALNKFGDRNAPTVLNAGFHIAQFVDGRAASLEEQAKGPPLNPIEMGMESAQDVEDRVKQLATHDYTALFNRAFPGQPSPISFDNIVDAIAAFERTLISRSRFDAFVEGDEQALSDQEKAGLSQFINVGCVQCHNGPLLGGMMYQKVGKFKAYANRKDLGRYDVTGREEDKFVFKVPQLRNAALTAPYFHDGNVKTLAEAIDLMGVMQLDEELTDEQIRSIMHFLTALSDKNLTSVTSAKIEAFATGWSPRQREDIPEGKSGDQIRMGLSLVSNSYRLIGHGAAEPEMQFSGNKLSCTNCHQNEGRKQFGLSWVGVTTRYPQFRGRSGKVGTLQDRVNGCMERSMNGKALPDESPQMQAIIAYMSWLSEDVPADVIGASGSAPFTPPDRKADIIGGQSLYQTYCSSCHGSDGEGYRSIAAGNIGVFVAPPLWGKNSYNNGAGMNRLLTIAAFLKGNMPLGTPYQHPALTDAQAYDIGAYVNSHPRPHLAGLEKDYPDLNKKPVDAPYGPYADEFNQEQHKYGPYAPIMRARAGRK
ncbi:cytochrome c peroxidase [Parasphingorhabdus sp.]|uniref:cytochrome c peroxidase n=1 Tax=Parasphingorhabdus sp. TaxID=2709688 RepID=UPI003A915970